MNDFHNRPQRAKELAMHRNTADRPMDQAGMAKMALEGACREQTWDESPLEVKVERVREALQRLEGVLDLTSKRAAEALAVAKVHEHGGKGDVLIPAAPIYRDAVNELHFDLRHIFARLR